MIRRGIGVQSFVSAGGDADAQAFITAAGITDATQQNAINTLVTDLKTYGVWTKMKAIYPFVGGTSSTHKFNLKDPRDLDAAFRLVFSGGISHSNTGALFNGTNGYANSYFQADTLSSSSAHISFYSRTDTAAGDKCEIGANMPIGTLNNFELSLLIKHTSNLAYPIVGYSQYPSVSNVNSQGFYIARRNDSTNVILDKNGSKVLTGAQTPSLPPYPVYIGAVNRGNTSITRYSDRECAFASIGDGLTDTDASNLYTAVQKYQTTLGRSVGTQTVSDSDAQAFVNAAVIEDQVQATAINSLVTDLKTYGIWTKMKAIYPFVGGTSSTHKWNLKDPRDLDAAFRLVFSGGWTHSSSGAKVNGINAYANTYFNLNNFTSTNAGASVYRNAITNGGSDIATYAGSNNSIFYNAWASNLQTVAAFSNNGTLNYADTSGLGLYTTNALSGTTKGYRNGVVKLTNTTQGTPPNVNSEIGRNTYGVEYADSRYGFAAYHDGLTDTEAANLYTAVQAYQTTLNRNI